MALLRHVSVSMFFDNLNLQLFLFLLFILLFRPANSAREIIPPASKMTDTQPFANFV